MRAMLIGSYTRAQAMEDGVLVDVSKLASEAGFRWPVAITQNLEAVLNDIPEEFSHQDFTGRLWDVVSMASMVARKGHSVDEMRYTIICQHTNDEKVMKELDLKMIVHAGDNFEPVITIDRLQ